MSDKPSIISSHMTDVQPFPPSPATTSPGYTDTLSINTPDYQI